MIPAAGAFGPAVLGPTVEVAGDFSGGAAQDPYGNLVWYDWYGACYREDGLLCPIYLSYPRSGSLSGSAAYVDAPLWGGLFGVPCDYCCLGLGVTDNCNRNGYSELCVSIHSP